MAIRISTIYILCLLVLSISFAWPQISPGQRGYIPLERPAYPLYAIISDLPDDKASVECLAQNFVLAQMGADREMLERIHKINPKFKAVHYINGTYTRPGDDLRLLESRYRRAFSMWLAGSLKEDIDASTRHIRLTGSDGRPARLKPSTISGDFSSTDPDKPSTQYYVTWIRIDDEFLRLDSFDAETGLFEVTRGFAGTSPAPHKAGSRVFCPIYIGSKDEYGAYPGSRKEATLRYAFDPGYEKGWIWQAEKVLECVREGYDGAWMDIISSTFFNMADMYGQQVQPWNFRKGRVYEPDEYREAHEKKIHFIQEYVKKHTGSYPCLAANNFHGPNYEPGKGGESLLLKPTKVKPRPIDAYCMENSILSMDGENARLRDFEKWRVSISAIARAAQEGIAAYPIIGPAGSKAVRLEPDTALRDRLERFGYASYLLAVERKGKTAFGIQAVYRQSDGTRRVRLNEQYFYPIGDPAESRPWNDFDGYKLPGKNTYMRRFTGGVVLVNPSEEEDRAIDLKKSYLDPQTGEMHASIDMPSQTGKILLDVRVH